MTEQKLLILPDADDMANRLVGWNGTGHLVQKFYPRLLKQAGRSMPALGYVIFVGLALADYTEGFAATDRSNVRTMMSLGLADLARALIDDVDLLGQVLDVYEISGVPTGREGS